MRNAAGKNPLRFSAGFLLASLSFGGLTAAAHPAFALSELQPNAESQAQKPAEAEATTPVQQGLPSPDPLINRKVPQTAKPETPDADTDAAETQPADSTEKPAEIIRDLTTLPEPVRKMRERIVEAAASGDIEQLRPILNPGPNQTQVMNGDGDDPVDTLKGLSGDMEGREILAILLDILSTGAAHFDTGTPEEVYVWPYFTGKALASLTPPEQVDLLRIITAGDLAGMEENGNYNFYRVGITPDGQWKFFSGGD